MATKRGLNAILILSVLFVLVIVPLTSADIIINQQPANVYNLGDTATIPVTIKTASNVEGIFYMDLICNGNEINFYKDGVQLAAGQEKNEQASLVLSRTIIGNSLGDCTIKAYLGSDYSLTSAFQISDAITITSNLSQTSFNPGDIVFIKGVATKENQNPANGYAEVILMDGNATILSQNGTVNNGFFSLNLSLPNDTASGSYLVRTNVYEEDLLGITTNHGSQDNNIFVNQVPTSLEIVFQNPQVMPGTDMSVKETLYDQTGIKIDTTGFLTVKDNNNKIINQVQVSTDNFTNFSIASDQAPANWTVVAVSNRLTSDSTFTILENENISTTIINNTITIANTGNVVFNKTILVKVGNQSLNLDVYLPVDQSQKWVLTAPDGQYNVQVINNGAITGAVVGLTGSSVDIQKAGTDFLSIVKLPIVWGFMILILGAFAFILFRRNYQKNFIGYAPISSSNKGGASIIEKNKGMDLTIYNPKSSRAEVAISIKGDKQEVSVLAVNIKNMISIKHTKGSGGEEVLQKIISAAEDQKAATYDNQDYLYFIFAPVRTKTFTNETTALRAAQKIKEILDSHNRISRQKIEFGISLNYGEIIAKQEPDVFKFMGMGNLMTRSKRIASLAQNNILLSEKMTDRVRTSVRVEKLKVDDLDVYALTEMKDASRNEKFLKGFMKRNG
ncbi:MAG: hypothetical protein ABSG05_02695 [Candidatus Pacearchaeota archaeon]|jgi:hypothetical protein